MAERQDPAALQAIGWRGDKPGRPLARVVAQHRAGYEIHDGQSVRPAQPGMPFLRPGLEPDKRPAVGDFVYFRPGDLAEITDILPRRSLLRRAAAGERYKRQIIASNIDTVMVLTGLDGDYNAKRIERYLTLITAAGIQPVVLLTKADLVADAEDRAAALSDRLPDDVPVLAIDTTDEAVSQTLAPWLAPGSSVVLVGSSGAGKSTLSNSLLGREKMATAAVRRRDSRGRHTTVHRALLQLPGGACLIDTPGMRELKLTGSEGLDAFSDIEALARQCRFNDCRHDSEPGCAVQAAIAAGDLDADRLHSFHKLATEKDRQTAMREARERRRQGRPKHDPRAR